ncbi:MAG: lipoprotein signal peptidase [Gammaproteobacteria bacterium]|nr:MAG: lipoprotein signal peptidase [Gammaproteobacteria bacterium]
MLKWLWLSVVVVIADQITKILVLQNFQYQESIAIFPSFNLVHVHNYGAAFSFLSDAGGWQRWLFAVLALVFSVLIVLWISRLKPGERFTAIGLALVLGGAIGNLVDRIYHGYVIDFLDFYMGTSHWPAFNVADIAISIGVVALIILSFFDDKERDDRGRDNNNAENNKEAPSKNG